MFRNIYYWSIRAQILERYVGEYLSLSPGYRKGEQDAAESLPG